MQQDQPDRDVGPKMDNLKVPEDDLNYSLELFSNISLSSRNALKHLEQFGDDFANFHFFTDLHSHHMMWIDRRYDWFIPHSEVLLNIPFSFY